MADKLKSQDHKDAIAMLMGRIKPFIDDRAYDSVGSTLAVIDAAKNPKKWRRESKRTDENGNVVRRFVDQFIDITVDTIEVELAPGTWSVSCDVISAPAWVSIAARKYVDSLSGGAPDISPEKMEVSDLKAPRLLSDEDNKPAGYGAFA
ncbi:MAG: hypothetical protein RR740_00570 [Pseudomonas sp.]